MSNASVLILTLNEESNIAGCLDSCAWSDDIVVFDSLSSDRTRSIAIERGARVIERRFDDYASQRNAALHEVTYAHPWVLMVDADERVPLDLASEIAECIGNAGAHAAMFRVRRKDFFMGRWLRRSSGYPTWFGRLVRPDKVQVRREINEEYAASGDIGYLKTHLHHFPFNKGLAFWLERHNRYSTMEAAAKIDLHLEELGARSPFTRDPIERRRILKKLLYRVPFRPIIVFLYLYLFRLGLLDGLPGLYFSQMRASYELFIDLKVVEAKRRRKGLAV